MANTTTNIPTQHWLIGAHIIDIRTNAKGAIVLVLDNGHELNADHYTIVPVTED